MSFSKHFSNNRIHISILIYILTVVFIWIMKPSIIFTKNGLPKEFGISKYNKTIFPYWLVVILTSILSYYIVAIIILYSN